MINIFREEGKYFNTSNPGIGTISSITPLKINYNDFVLNRENLKVNKDISLEIGNEVFLYPTENEQTYIVICVVI
nr:DUF2577 family protein [Clostridium niameyense]